MFLKDFYKQVEELSKNHPSLDLTKLDLFINSWGQNERTLFKTELAYRKAGDYSVIYHEDNIIVPGDFVPIIVLSS